MRSPSDWGVPADDLLEDLLGRTLPGRIDGGRVLPGPVVVQVTAVTPFEGERRVLRIGEQTPRSAVDFYLLNATRAWANVILTSGQILRDEPELSFALDGPNESSRRALATSRSERTGAAPRVGVLTSGSGLDESMAVWSRGGEFVLITDAEGARRSAGWVERAGVELAELQPVGPREAVDWAREAVSDSADGGRVSVEFGGNSSADLYPAPSGSTIGSPLVDMLLLSEYRGRLADAVRGDPFLPGLRLEDFYEPGPEARIGDWSFRCWNRRERAT